MRLVNNLLHSYDAAGNNLIIVVGAEEKENAWIGEALAEHAAISMAPNARGLTVVNTDFTTVGAREKMYARGGIYSITSRILVVDLLTNLLDPERITGIVLLHAEKVIATSLEAFILRIYRQKNKVGFLKAFSDNPDPFTYVFSPLATMMKNMFLRKTSLWPRYHVTVASSLEGKKKAEVIELEVPMTDAMKEIQTAIMECVEVSIHELKKSNTGLEMDDWNLDSALLKNFDVMVRRQLDPNWHRVSWKTKQIVSDLTVLRGMLHSLLTFDAVSFPQHLDTIHAAHSPQPGSTRQSQSPWLFLDAAHTIFNTGKERVYANKAKATEKSTIESLSPVLEEQPKWAVLADILEEIDRDLYFEPPGRDDSNGTILIMCSDTNTCRQLKDYLQTMHIHPQQDESDAKHQGGKKKKKEKQKPSGAFMMRRRLRGYLNWKKEFAQISTALFSENQKALEGAVDPRLAQGGYKGRAPANKRRRQRGGGVAAPGRAANGSVAQYFEKPSEVAGLMDEVRATTTGGEEGVNVEDAETEADRKAGVMADPLEDMEDYFELYEETRDLVVVHAYEGDQDEHVLEELRPRYVIMYEPDAAFIRRVEVYRSSHNDRAVRVYFVYYGGSVEEQRYLASVRREKDAFARLIKERASMAVVMTTDAHGAPDGTTTDEDAFLRTVNTRIAGGGRLAATAQPPRVVVDVREFRSSLPSLLHGRSMVVVPCMLTVGDYVLSPSICVERKSVSDLVSSFRDGRLYAQAESMALHYRDCVLLIEFDAGKSFTLEPFADLSGSRRSLAVTPGPASTPSAGGAPAGGDTGASDLQSRLVLLTLAFPRLRIVWSSSPYQTAEIFEALKSHQDEPDPVAAVRAGLDPALAAGLVGDAVQQGQGQGSGQRPFNLEPHEMLAAVPGVTPKNIGNLTFGVGSTSASSSGVGSGTAAGAEPPASIRDVANMRVPELEPLVGREAARRIHGFFSRSLIDLGGDDED